MSAQRDRLLSLATLANVQIRVLPVVEGKPPWCSFDYRIPIEGNPYVTLELPHRGLVVDHPEEVAPYAQLWSSLWESGVHGDEAVDVIHRTWHDEQREGRP